MNLLKLLLTLLLASSSISVHAHSFDPFKFIALGDMPYTIPEDYVRYEQLIKAINGKDPSFSIFVGDTKSGSTPCSDENNQKVKNYFDQFASPLVYSIGDNEWTDCHRALAGSYDPIERLGKLRSTFFSNRESQGHRRLILNRQADSDPRFSKFVENSYWVKNHIIFVNLHIPGSNNNFERNQEAISEYRERNTANIEWIKQMFAKAKSNEYVGIVFAFQADIFYSLRQATELDSGYKDSLEAFTIGSQELRKPVLLIHGDSHRLIIDQPLKSSHQDEVIENVIRLEVMGDKQIQAVEITVNPKAEQPFGFTPLLLKQNMRNPMP
ncbi:hypothetical protein [Polynucleobacter sp. UK-Kesae-W10]|uniref:hypothetical protein n=1 Tax=Polynucleobacter sp. UK-Kesae-W10 TaxID=1819738 RepID=UPI001C0C8FBC|nr:hypothetical protein [Polynucleobacter sp. UK-Kesae-W10]MBU3578016.1 hypothetical protein [Polynucleobacter sp. UK-Kesae-W10]